MIKVDYGRFRREQLERDFYRCVDQLSHASIQDTSSVRELLADCEQSVMDYEMSLAARPNVGETRPRELSRYIARCKACGTATSTLADSDHTMLTAKIEGAPYARHINSGALQYVNAYLCMPCRKCGGLRVAKRVFGVYSSREKCGARCRNATGFDCECQCSGLNHGKGYDPSEE